MAPARSGAGGKGGWLEVMGLRFATALGGVVVLGLGAPGLAQPLDWSLCTVERVVPVPPDWEGGIPVEAGDFEVYADFGEVTGDGVSVLSGDVRARSEEERFHAGELIYHQQARSIDLEDGLQYWGGDIYLSGTAGHYELDTDQGWVDDASFRVGDHHGRGGGSTVRFSGAEMVLVEDARYTTCDPGSEVWLLEAETLAIDRREDVGTARNVRLRVKGVPVLYSPWLSFPLSDARKSGFLQPSFGDGSDTGVEVTVPYYWNIAPERDATFAVRAMAERGALLMGEYRYLMPNGAGQVNVEYLPEDDRTGESRGLFVLDHRQRFGPHWDTVVDFKEVSDDDYFRDLGTDLSVAAARFLHRTAHARYVDRSWWALARVDDYQTIDETIPEGNRPYRRLPQLLASYRYPARDPALQMRVDGEAVAFDQDARVDGTRIDVEPSLAYELRTLSGFVIPRVSLQHTRYALDGPGGAAGDEITRTVPTFSLDNGVFLERELTLGGRGWLQTLEPRLFYLYVPFRDQDDIPLFDTSAFTFGYAQLFREDRFSGADRVGDANQLSVAVTSRLLASDSGREVLRGTLGRIFFFDDRDVTLRAGSGPDTASTSDLVAEVAAQLAGGWSADLGLQWDTDEDRTERGTVRLRYRPNARSVLNGGYRFVRDRLEQIDLSGRWPLSPRLAVLGRWNMEIPDQRLLEGFAGFEYQSCCWALRAVARRYLNNDEPGEEEYSSGVFFQVELKGLAGLGDRTGRFLEEQIPGYRNAF